MKTIIIICEGETEVEFCYKLLNTYLEYQYRIETRNLGGNCNWQRIKNFIEKSLKSQPDAIVTTMVDYYGLKGTTFPKWEESLNILDKRERINFLEKNMRLDIQSSLQNRFIPYLQLHEFEALLFNNSIVFAQNFDDEEYNKGELEKVLSEYPDPEMINDKKETSPSYRLLNIVKDYDKIVHGNILIDNIGISNIYNKNQHFREWIDKLKSV